MPQYFFDLHRSKATVSMTAAGRLAGLMVEAAHG